MVVQTIPELTEDDGSRYSRLTKTTARGIAVCPSVPFSDDLVQSFSLTVCSLPRRLRRPCSPVSAREGTNVPARRKIVEVETMDFIAPVRLVL